MSKDERAALLKAAEDKAWSQLALAMREGASQETAANHARRAATLFTVVAHAKAIRLGRVDIVTTPPTKEK